MSPFHMHGHPSLEDWLRWADDPAAFKDAAAMELHAQGCAQCRGEADLLRDVGRARRVQRWALPPASVRARTRRFPGHIATPPAASARRTMAWLPTDVRSDTLNGPAGSRIVSQILDEAELSVQATPPQGDGAWRLEGRVWLRKPAGRIQLVLRHDDHILARREVDDGEFFEIEDVVGPGWVLEVHLPSGQLLTLEDPDR
jgi:hypothetical protein